MRTLWRMGFEETYCAAFGERWPALRAALLREGPYAVRRNPLAGSAEDLPADASAIPGLSGAWRRATQFPAPGVTPVGLATWYAMDAASLLACDALEVQPGDRVLDLCAAPGGKAWNLAVRLAAAGELVANDRSSARRARLHHVLAAMLPRELRERVRVTGHDASLWSRHETQAFDRVLLDAPCSSERHVLKSERALKQWTPARSRQLARRQYAMLASALDVVRPGGRVVYSTCALLSQENDDVIQRALDSKRGPRITVRRADAPLGEATKHGTLVLPDRDAFGPIYFAVLDVGP